MKEIKIINGVYGHRPDGGFVVPVSTSDGTIEVSDEEAARLVKLGVAAMVSSEDIADAVQSMAASGYTVDDTGEESATNPVATPQNGAEDGTASNGPVEESGGAEGDENAQENPPYSADMKAAELRDLMEACGLTYKVGMSKADMVAALDAYYSEAEDTDEEPPVLAPEIPS